MPRPSKAAGSVALVTGAKRGLCHTMINFI
jgi:hypothetical protein